MNGFERRLEGGSETGIQRRLANGRTSKNGGSDITYAYFSDALQELLEKSLIVLAHLFDNAIRPLHFNLKCLLLSEEAFCD